MPTPSRRALSISLAAVAVLTAAGCAKATVVAAPWGEPIDALNAAAEALEDGVAFSGSNRADGMTLETNGEDNPSAEELRLYQEAYTNNTEVAAEYRLVGDELWMRISGLGGDGDWGHFTEPLMVATMSESVVGPSVWIPELFEQITSVERTGERKFGGVLDLTEADPEKTGIDQSVMRDLPDEAEECVFSVRLNADGSLDSFTVEVENTDNGDLTVGYTFREHGAPPAVTEPDGKIVEVTADNAMEWLSGT
ncbi:MAG TPA: hypothetical protein VGF17_26630 [Phytomonospora sp.]